MATTTLKIVRPLPTSNIKIKLAVDRSWNRVLFADAGSDFVEVLLSFLTLPLSALHLSAGASSPGCLSNLCESVSNLSFCRLLKDDEACHGMLLRPRHKEEFELCNRYCDHKATFLKSQRSCRCWEVMARLVHVYQYHNMTAGILTRNKFLKGRERFVISDDCVMQPSSTRTVLSLLHSFGRDGIDYNFEELEVYVGWEEVISMLTASLTSKTVLTDAFLSKETDQAARVAANPSFKPNIMRQCNKELDFLPQCKIKLFFDWHEKKVMYVECKHEFVDLLLSLLTYPVNCAMLNMGGTSFLGSAFGNLYSSAVDLGAAGFLTGCLFAKEMLLDPCLAPFKMWGIDSKQAIYPKYLKDPFFEKHEFVNDYMYVVEDSLLIYQSSPMLVMKHWCKRDKDKVLEMDITVGKQEAVALLRAVFTSKTALTDVFMCMLEEPTQPFWSKPPPPSKRIVSSSLQKMQVFVTIQTGKTITLEVGSSDTIATVKSRIQDKVRIPVGCRHELFYGGRYLKNSGTVADYNIAKECTIHSAFYMNGSS